MLAPSSVHPLRELARTVSPEVLRQAINELTPKEADIVLHDWSMWARPDQIAPPGNWQYWLIMAGRGWGKSRTGAEFVKEEIKTSPYVNLIGATAADARDIMVDGESGILASCSKQERPRFIKNESCLNWPNGAKSLIFTADAPERLRGKQHSALWADELAAWRYREAWDQAQFGLRIGRNPRAAITTTPRPTALVKSIIKDPNTVITRGTTYDNKANLATAFLNAIIKAYEGTRLGRQELNAELLEDNPNALWQRLILDTCRITYAPPDLQRIVIGIDPASTAKKNSDETGIIVAGIDNKNHGYVLDDLTGIYTPAEWARKVAQAYERYSVDRVVAETNNGGDMVEAVLRSVSPNISYSSVHASRGKAIRAEPISSLYERQLIHHVGFFARLEDQMCDFDPMNPPEKSPDRMDAMVWAFTDLFESTGLVFGSLN